MGLMHFLLYMSNNFFFIERLSPLACGRYQIPKDLVIMFGSCFPKGYVP